MMTLKNYLSISILLPALFLMAACGNNEEKNESVNKLTSKQKYQHKIDSIEAKMQANRDMPLDHGTAMFAMKCYDEYASFFPDEAKSPEYLFKAGELANSMQMPQPALKYLSNVVTKYPNYKNVPFALFMEGMIYEDQLKDTASARKLYQEIIVKYPETQMAKDAQASIQNLGISAEDLIRSFEKNQSASAKK